MHIITGVFDSTTHVERAVRELMDIGITDDQIGVVVRDPERGGIIADDLGREFRTGDTLPHTSIFSRSDVLQALPDSFMDTIHEGGLPERALSWYQDKLDEGHILLAVDAGDRSTDVKHILNQHGVVMYHTERMTGETVTERMEEKRTYTERTEEKRRPAA